jgi:septum formation protein
MQKIILASKSPRRWQILELANVSFEINVIETDETYPPDLSPEEIAIHIAVNKARAVIKAHPALVHEYPVLSADTIVVLNNEIIGKPVDRNHAIEILQKLSGKSHLVITGVMLLFNDREVTFTDTTEVEFHTLTNEQVEYYVDNYKPFDKAGAYAIQEWIGAVGIKKIDGDFYNVMGLPISRVLIELDKIRK